MFKAAKEYLGIPQANGNHEVATRKSEKEETDVTDINARKISPQVQHPEAAHEVERGRPRISKHQLRSRSTSDIWP